MLDIDGLVQAAAAPRALERRRFPRNAVPDTRIRLNTVIDTEVLDISLAGALFRCQCQLDVGDRAQIRTLLNGQPFVAWVTVLWTRRERSSNHAGALRVGTKFVALDENAERTIRHLVKG